MGAPGPQPSTVATGATGASATGAPVVVGERCTGCGACLLTCPEHALRPVPRGLLVRADRCTGCLECIEVCPADAIALVA